jgi:hypothetical protein
MAASAWPAISARLSQCGVVRETEIRRPVPVIDRHGRRPGNRTAHVRLHHPRWSLRSVVRTIGCDGMAAQSAIGASRQPDASTEVKDQIQLHLVRTKRLGQTRSRDSLQALWNPDAFAEFVEHYIVRTEAGNGDGSIVRRNRTTVETLAGRVQRTSLGWRLTAAGRDGAFKSICALGWSATRRSKRCSSMTTLTSSLTFGAEKFRSRPCALASSPIPGNAARRAPRTLSRRPGSPCIRLRSSSFPWWPH